MSERCTTDIATRLVRISLRSVHAAVLRHLGDRIRLPVSWTFRSALMAVI
jgi:hypothetical protein